MSSLNEKMATVKAPGNATPFALAVRAFVNEPTKRKMPAFIEEYLKGGEKARPQDVEIRVKAVEKERSKVGSILRQVFQAVYDYDGVLGTLGNSTQSTEIAWYTR